MLAPAEVRATAVAPTVRKQRYRTCCSMCHIKYGTMFMGMVEAVVCVCILLGVIQQLMWKSQTVDLCEQRFLKDCLIYKFSHFNVTLVLDYVVAIMMVFILFSIMLLFCGICSDTSCLLLPHIVVQFFFLLFSLGYFIFYAWSYFYGDLYTHKMEFQFQSFIERMWLASLLLLVAALQTYLFSAVVRCSIYIKKVDSERRRRESAFSRCSERVRIAKENGLWRGDGGFQQYKGQYDDPPRPKKEKKDKEGGHVQWNLQKNVVVEHTDEETEPLVVERPSPKRVVVVDEQAADNDSPPREKKISTTVKRSETHAGHSQPSTSKLQSMAKTSDPGAFPDEPSTSSVKVHRSHSSLKKERDYHERIRSDGKKEDRREGEKRDKPSPPKEKGSSKDKNSPPKDKKESPPRKEREHRHRHRPVKSTSIDESIEVSPPASPQRTRQKENTASKIAVAAKVSAAVVPRNDRRRSSANDDYIRRSRGSESPVKKISITSSSHLASLLEMYKQ